MSNEHLEFDATVAVACAARAFRVPMRAVNGTRHSAAVNARRALSAALRHYRGETYTEIGDIVGRARGRPYHYTTVMHHVGQHREMLKQYPTYRAKFARLLELLAEHNIIPADLVN